MIIMNGEQVRIWKETITAYLNVLSWRSPAEAGENHEKLLRTANGPVEIRTS
jgi:hypothetical protein